MGSAKKQVRARFRKEVFDRDGGKCRKCGAPGVDAHHIHDRHDMPDGGYTLDNGITVCAACHELAEVFHRTGTAYPGYAPEDLLALIGVKPRA